MDNVAFVLRYCKDSARRGEREISVFDLMYEGIEYTKLRDVLATLAERGEVEITDIKTFKFIGEVLDLSAGRNSGIIEDAPITGIDDEYIRALEYVIQNNDASASFINRRCGTGYLKACKILEWMESQGYISPPNGPYARKVLITEEEFNAKFRQAAFNSLYDNDDDDEDYEEDPFEALERFQEERLNDAFREYEKKLKEEPSLSEEFLRDDVPLHPSWSDEFEFIRTVRQTKVKIIKSDKNMGVKGAIKKAKEQLVFARDIGDEMLAEVYERLIYELGCTTPYEYTKLKKKYFQ